MGTTIAHDRDLILKDLQPLMDLAHEGFDRGIALARQYFEKDSKLIDIVLFNSIVRYEVKQYLGDRGHTVEVEYQPEDIANIGLGLTYGKYHVRMWKSDDGEIPPPGRSRNKLLFFEQLVQGEFEFPDLPRPIDVNLALLWRLGPAYQFEGMWLACPKWVSGRYSAVHVHWSEPVTHSAFATVARTTVETAQAESDDLPFGVYDGEGDSTEQAG